jgi:tetratricopeptide (TPR) repeat protein
LALNPLSSVALNNLTVAEFRLGHEEKAFELSKVYCQAAPENVGSHILFATICEKTGRLNEAKEAVERARAVQDKHRTMGQDLFIEGLQKRIAESLAASDSEAKPKS